MLIKPKQQIKFIGNSGDFCWLRSASLVSDVPTIARKEL